MNYNEAKMKSCYVIFAICLTSLTAIGQQQLDYPGRPRYADGLLGLRVSGGMSKYLGEFTDQSTGGHFSLCADYSVLPEISFGLGADFGRTPYYRRERRQMVTAYGYQYDNAATALRSTWYSTYSVQIAIHMFPRQYFDAYLLLGGGVTLFGPDDYSQELVTVRPDNDHLAGITVPIGIGADYFLTRNLSINAELRFHLLFTDDFDGFNSSEIRRAYIQDVQEPLTGDILTEAGDAYSAFSFGIKYRLFENDDIDGDLLKNVEEEALNTNPYDPDTDGDGVSDYQELRIHKSDPLRADTDADGLNDYVEVIKYRTSPLLADTDGDGLSDSDEVLEFRTNPLAQDTDGDGLADKDELALGTNQTDIDTDKDDVGDHAEAITHKTIPTAPDSAGDGLGDYDEIFGYRTDPLKPDTDGDRLTDFEEIALIRSNPLLADTDGDSWSDYTEARETGTNPLSRDTDGDGMPDNLDQCPLLPEVYNGYEDSDGCPDQEQGGRRQLTTARADRPPLAVPAVLRDTLVRIDTLVVREGGLFTLFGVNFEVDKDIIRPESIPILEENAKLFFEFPRMEVEIRGHTDSDASDEHNLDLSLRRAKSVRRFLISKGVEEGRLTVQGFGESRPIVSNATAFGKARNRRIEFYISHRGERRRSEQQLFTGEPRIIEPSAHEQQ